MIVQLALILLTMLGVYGIGAPPYVPDYLPPDSFFGDCDPGIFPFKHKCIHADTYDVYGLYTQYCQFALLGYPDIIESEEERQFYFDEIMGGQEGYVYQSAAGNATFQIDYYYSQGIDTDTDFTYLWSKITDLSVTSSGFVCHVTRDDMTCVENDGSLTGVHGPCTYARGPYSSKEPHPCDLKLKKKLRRDATRTLVFPNKMTDICYLTIKGKRMRPSMVKIFGYSSKCPTGFLISAKTDLHIDVASLPTMHCGNGLGSGRKMLKRSSARGKELRVYVALNGDGKPMKIRTKGTSYVLAPELMDG